MAASLHLPVDVESMEAQQVLAFVLEQFPGKAALACSFQKEETILLELLFALEPNARVFAIDTHHLFPETYAYWREVEQRYGTKIEVFEGPAVADGLWETKPDLYLSIAKIAPLVTRARRARRLGDGHSPRPVADACERAEARLGRAARALEGKPARGLDGRDVLVVHPRTRPAVQPTA